VPSKNNIKVVSSALMKAADKSTVFAVCASVSVIVTKASTKVKINVCPVTPPVIVATVLAAPSPVMTIASPTAANVVAAKPKVAAETVRPKALFAMFKSLANA
jgi:hypothetical protein